MSRHLPRWATTLLALILVFALLGCPSTADDDDSGAADDDAGDDDDTAGDPCSAAWDLGAATIEATVDGYPPFATTGGRYTTAGGLVVNGTDGVLSLTLSSLVDEDGQSLPDAIDAGAYPLHVLIGQNGAFTGYATVYEGATTYISDDEHTGWVHLSGVDGAELVGCFEFEAKSATGDEVQVWTDGRFHVPPM